MTNIADSPSDSLQHTPSATTFKFAERESDRSKYIVKLVRSDLMFSAVQVLRSGGENNLHSHEFMDGFWFVLQGRVRFYTTDDEVVGELGKYEGILVTRNYPYWFEAIGEEEAHLLQVEATVGRFHSDQDVRAGRTDYNPPPETIATLLKEPM